MPVLAFSLYHKKQPSLPVFVYQKMLTQTKVVNVEWYNSKSNKDRNKVNT